MDLSADIFKVTIGEELCTDVHVTESKITCKPPAKKPNGDTTVKVNNDRGFHPVISIVSKQEPCFLQQISMHFNFNVRIGVHLFQR